MASSTISSHVSHGVTFDGATYFSPLTVTSTGIVTPVDGDAVYASFGYGTATVVNQGTITGGSGGDGIDLKDGGTVDNQGGTITGSYGIYFGLGFGSITNTGTIFGTDLDGVDATNGVYVDNSGTAALIEGKNKGCAGFTQFSAFAFGAPSGNDETLKISDTLAAPGTVVGFSTYHDIVDLTQIDPTGAVVHFDTISNIMTVSNSSQSATLRLDAEDLFEGELVAETGRQRWHRCHRARRPRIQSFPHFNDAARAVLREEASEATAALAVDVEACWSAARQRKGAVVVAQPRTASPGQSHRGGQPRAPRGWHRRRRRADAGTMAADVRGSAGGSPRQPSPTAWFQKPRRGRLTARRRIRIIRRNCRKARRSEERTRHERAPEALLATSAAGGKIRQFVKPLWCH